MTLKTWWLFVVAVSLLSATPGPSMLHILSRSVELGLRRTIAAMAGILTAICTVMAASAAGLTALLIALPGAFEVLRYLGVAYLVYLGIRAWRADAPPIDLAGGGEGGQGPALSPGAVFRGGFAIGISNPKLLLFTAAFLPQFVNPAVPQAPQFAILVATFAAIETLCYFAYALGGHSLSRWLRRPGLRRLFNRVTGGIFIGFGLALLRVRPH